MTSRKGEAITIHDYGSVSESEEWTRIPFTRMRSNNDGRGQQRYIQKVLWIVTSGLFCVIVYTLYFYPANKLNEDRHSSPEEEMLSMAHVSFDRYPKQVRKLLNELDTKMIGHVLYPFDKGFDKAASFFNELSSKPFCVLQAANAADVQLAVPVLGQLATQFGIPWQVKAGGHKYTGFDGGIVLSVSHLNALQVEYPDDPTNDKALATFGPGTTVGQILQTCLVGAGFGGVLGSASSVAMGGFITGGGVGLWSRKYGLAIDHVRSMQLVLANGTKVTASSQENQDLFWAMRGAGQDGFAVVTEVEYELWPTSSTQLVTLITIPMSDLAQFLTSVGNVEVPGEVFIEVNSDDQDIEVTVSWYGEDESSLAHGQLYMNAVLPTLLPSNLSEYQDTERVSIFDAALEEEAFNGNLVRSWNGFLVHDDNTLETWNYILDIMEKLRSPYVMFDIELFGGAIAAKDPTSTPYFWRDAVYDVGIIVLVPLQERHAHHKFEKHVALVERVWPDIAKHLHGTYANYAMATLNYHRQTASELKYGQNLPRLQSIKESVDPECIFRGPQSIPSLQP